MKKPIVEEQAMTPEAIAQKAASMPWKKNARVNLLPYENAIAALRERGYSYGEIATWLTKELNAPVKRGQVYYVCQIRDADYEEQFRQAEAAGKVRTLPAINLSPEDAERSAIEADESGAKPSRKKGGKR